jgi:hypothetical protein
MRYAVMFEVDTNEWMYATGKKVFSYKTPRITFGSEAQAEELRKTFNNAVIVKVEGDIKELTKEERHRSLERHNHENARR